MSVTTLEQLADDRGLTMEDVAEALRTLPRPDGSRLTAHELQVLDVVLAEAVQAGHTLPVTEGLTWTIWRTSGEVHLLDLRSRWSQRTRTGTHRSTAPHQRTQPWARAIRTHYPHLHGILSIPATGGRALAVALNETSTTHLAGPIELSRPLRHPQLLSLIGHTAQHLGITLDLT